MTETVKLPGGNPETDATPVGAGCGSYTVVRSTQVLNVNATLSARASFLHSPTYSGKSLFRSSTPLCLLLAFKWDAKGELLAIPVERRKLGRVQGAQVTCKVLEHKQIRNSPENQRQNTRNTNNMCVHAVPSMRVPKDPLNGVAHTVRGVLTPEYPSHVAKHVWLIEQKKEMLDCSLVLTSKEPLTHDVCSALSRLGDIT